MKRLGILTVFIMLMAVVTTAHAEVRAGAFSVTPFFGGYIFEGNENDLQDSWTAGVRAGYNFTNHVGVEGYFNYILTNGKWDPASDGNDVRIGGFGVEGLYNFFPKSRIVPFLAVGIGGIHYSWQDAQISDTTKFSVDYGAGLKLFLPDKIAKYFYADDIALRADIRHVIPLNDRYNDLMGTIGITFSFGGKKKSFDSDADDVTYETITKRLNIEFDTAKYDIKDKYRDEIKKIADFMKKHGKTTAHIEGYTDNIGSKEFNLVLSNNRANSVRQYLIKEFGIKASRITAKGYGESKPIASNDTEEGRQKNRRVEAVLQVMEVK